MESWYASTTEELLTTLRSSAKGISEEEASLRLQQYGANKLMDSKRKSPIKMLFQQFTEVMVLILIAAALLSLFLGKTTEAVAILAIVLLFGLLGFFQEYQAENAMAALNQLVVPTVRVRRNGVVKELPATELVPGDIVEFEAGNVIPADLRLLESFNLKIQEAALTGESEPVDKISKPIVKENLPLGDRTNLAYMGTIVSYGRGIGVTVATGMATELGKIANLISAVATTKTPLQEKLDKLGKLLALVGVIAALIIFMAGILKGVAWPEMFLTAVSVAVAVIPEGLPAVVTITLAIGGQRMLKHNALIRKLPAVETLGSVTVICSDKTGTLTQNKMTVTVVDLPDNTVEFKNSGLEIVNQQTATALDFTLAVSVLCNDATLEVDGNEPNSEKVLGDPTETALLVAGAQRNIYKQELYQTFPRINEIPFDSVRKKMSTIHRAVGNLPGCLSFLQKADRVVFTKGAPDSIIDISEFIWVNNNRVPLTDEWKKRVKQANTRLAQQGIRVLGFAFRVLDEAHTTDLEKELTFIGLMGMIDPPRLEVKSAVAKCKAAGIRPVMITGDHPLTATAIATALDFNSQSEAVSGEMLQKINENQLQTLSAKTAVYARVSPEDKLKIVEALQKTGHVVAMTGDGVNDSPALKKADIGVAMGITGTDVAKEAADMVLLDDNFSTIVAAVEEGRVIFTNLRRFIKFSLAGNIGKVIIMLVAPFFGMTIALRPLQLLWLNLLTDGLLGLGLGTEPAEEGIMNRPPRNPEKGALSKRDFLQLGIVGIVIAAITLGLAVFYYNPQQPNDLTWQTMIFATVGFAQVFQAISLRSFAYSPFSLFTNPLMTLVVISTILLQVAVIYIPFMKSFFGLVPLPAKDLLISLAAGSIIFFVIALDRKRRKRESA
ncbi:cation-translocating P-type ATPase [Adhaeribacter radiodurans]|uniref:Cation-translocating P-type ATPase n=1 Tax=Adhaeribacter radiodurans TaxID=2745197 RepID=A0A7L7L378_9BACT|nr:cation-translocating P-type ATPase [Adhaeribacter radiodurans]QMU27256.1 cation-translocating P-type ATPase [Adhaeribacter radiodurans]